MTRSDGDAGLSDAPPDSGSEPANAPALHSEDEPMAQLRPGEPPGAPLSRARVFGALFGHDSKASAFGRFHVLRRLGAGGMGVVYEAYDPDLARGVALKIVEVAGQDRGDALAEAKALARLSHPHVVPIYEAGLDGDRVYLVMELVRGRTLREPPAQRGWRGVLEVYRQAGLALAAAHEAGLVHRDFKPDNAIVGTDGRVRVVDFGLACEAGATRRAAGTPRFMAPELAAGGEVTPAADQYSFCVALEEALAAALERAEEPPPRRVALVLARGRAPEPAARFPSMPALLHALTHDPARRRRRVAAVAGLVAAVGAAAFLAGRSAPADAEEPAACTAGSEHLEAAWPAAQRTGALERLATLGPAGAPLRGKLERDLGLLSEQWLAHHRAACLARHRGTDSDEMSGRRTACLGRVTDALATVGGLIARAAPDTLAELPRAVQAIPDPQLCSRFEALSADVPPPAPALAAPVAQLQQRLGRARIFVSAGRYPDARGELRPIVAGARELGYAPLLAEALLVDGRAAMMMSELKAAVPVLAEAVSVAMLAGADAVAVEAWARRAWAQGTSGDPAGAVAGLDLIEPLARRTPAAAFARALLYNNLGSVELGREQRAQARAYFERALAESRRIPGRGDLELVAIRANLALVTDDRAEGDRYLREAATELADRLGPDHPDTLAIRKQRGLVTIEDLPTALELLLPTCEAHRAHAGLAWHAARCWTEVALLRSDLGLPSAAEAMDEAARAPHAAPEAGPYAALWRGDARAAIRQLTAALAAHPPRPGEPSWERLTRSELALGLGRAHRAAGELPEAQAALEQSIADLEVIVGAHLATNYARRLGRARVELALTLAAAGAQPERRRVVVEEAAAWLRRVRGDERLLAIILQP